MTVSSYDNDFVKKEKFLPKERKNDSLSIDLNLCFNYG